MPKQQVSNRSKVPPTKGVTKKRKEDPLLSAYKREVNELTGAAYEGREKRRWKQEKLKSLGAKEQKNVKMPYPLLMKLKKRQAEKEKEFEEKQLLHTGFHQKSLAKKVDKQLAEFNQRVGNRRGDRNSVGDGKKGFRPALGRFKGGALVLSPNDIKRVASTKSK